MEQQGKKFSLRRFRTLFIVLGVHCGVIFIPLGVMLFMPEKPKPVAFRVKLGGNEPSHAPEIGPPERRRTTGTVGGGAPPPPEVPPEKPPVTPPPKKPVQPPPPKVEPKPVQKPKPKPTPKPKPKPKTDRKRLERQRRLRQERERKQKELARQRWLKKVRERRLQQERERKQKELARQRWLKKMRERQRRQQSQVHHDPRGDTWDPSKPFGGGSNTNRNVPIGNRDRGQARGPVDGRTPAGGASVNEEKYWQRIQEFFHEKWQEPAGVFVTAETAVTIRVEVDARGRVIRKSIVKYSPNAAVNQSVKVMLNQLDYIPSPPAGVTRSFDLQLVSQ